MRRDHPAAQGFDMVKSHTWPDTTMWGRGDMHTSLNVPLANMGQQRRIEAVVSSFQLIPSMLAQTDYMAMLTKRGFDLNAPPSLIGFAPPIEKDGFPLHLGYLASHARQTSDCGVQHLIAEIRRIVAP